MIADTFFRWGAACGLRSTRRSSSADYIEAPSTKVLCFD
jgi:hypothetical protein